MIVRTDTAALTQAEGRVQQYDMMSKLEALILFLLAMMMVLDQLNERRHLMEREKTAQLKVNTHQMWHVAISGFHPPAHDTVCDGGHGWTECTHCTMEKPPHPGWGQYDLWSTGRDAGPGLAELVLCASGGHNFATLPQIQSAHE